MRRAIATVALFGAALVHAAEPSDWISHLGGKVERDAAGNIVAVNLRGSWINDVEMLELVRLPRLERLDLSHTRISDEGMLNLKTAPRISDLNLFYSEWVTDQGLTAIRDWKHLKRLNVRGTRISDGTLAIVSKMPGLEALDIANTQVSDNGLDYLITLTNLKELSIGRSRLTDNALEVLRMLPTLTYLDLGGARANSPDLSRRRAASSALPEGMIRAISDMKDLRTLKLGYSSISGDGLRALAVLNKVEKLGLEACVAIDNAALKELVAWKGLRYVDVQDTRVTKAGIEALRKVRADLVVLANAK